MIGDDKVRYVLKKEGTKPLVVLGVNPSIADNVSTDKTITRVRGFAERLGFDSFVMLNVYPIRSPKIEKLPSDIDIDLHNHNMDCIVNEISLINNPTILIAYGNSIYRKKYLKTCLKDIMDRLVKVSTASFIQLGHLTKKGNPRHPLMARADIEIIQYEFK